MPPGSTSENLPQLARTPPRTAPKDEGFSSGGKSHVRGQWCAHVEQEGGWECINTLYLKR